MHRSSPSLALVLTDLMIDSRIRSLRSSRSNSLRRRIPAYSLHRYGTDAGANYVRPRTRSLALRNADANSNSTTKKGSITSVQAVYVPADDLTDPAPATTFAHLDATTVLSRGIAELGIYPAVDPLDSKSRMLDPRVVGQEHYDIATNGQSIVIAT